MAAFIGRMTLWILSLGARREEKRRKMAAGSRARPLGKKREEVSHRL